MPDLLFAVLLAVVCGGVGVPAARLLPFSVFRWRLLAAPTFGIALLAVAVNVAYRVGVAPQRSFVLAACAALVFLVMELRRWGRPRGASADTDVAERRALLYSVLVWMGSVGLLLAPRWVGGDQLAVFQGNHWDTFGYLHSALVYARQPYEAVASAGVPEFLRNPLVETASTNLFGRPAVHLLYAAFSGVAPEAAPRLHYAFLVFLLSQSALVIALLLRSWLPRARVPVLFGVAVVFELGFWGQYVFDINSWSQIASVSMMLLLVGLMVETAALSRQDGDSSARRRLAWPLAVVVAGGVYVYPESLAYHLAVLVPLVVAALGARAFRARRASLESFFPLIGLAGAAAGVLYWRGTLGFAVEQAKFTQRAIVPWWHFFQAFLQGRDDLFLEQGTFAATVDFLAGVFGLYFATPASTSTGIAALLQRLAVLLVVIGLLGALAGVLLERIGSRQESGALARASRSRVRLGALAVASLLVPSVIMVLQGNYWPAGKGLSYVSPVFMAMLALPLVAGPTSTRSGWLRFVTAAFVVFQIGTGFARIAAARDPSGILYARPYPSVQDENMKRRERWDLEMLGARLAGTSRVFVAQMEPWLASHVMSSLYARDIDFFALGPIARTFGTGDGLGSMTPPWKADAMIVQDRTGLVVLYADGRPAARVAWSAEVR